MKSICCIDKKTFILVFGCKDWKISLQGTWHKSTNFFQKIMAEVFCFYCIFQGKTTFLLSPSLSNLCRGCVHSGGHESRLYSTTGAPFCFPLSLLLLEHPICIEWYCILLCCCLVLSCSPVLTPFPGTFVLLCQIHPVSLCMSLCPV